MKYGRYVKWKKMKKEWKVAYESAEVRRLKVEGQESAE